MSRRFTHTHMHDRTFYQTTAKNPVAVIKFVASGGLCKSCLNFIKQIYIRQSQACSFLSATLLLFLESVLFCLMASTLRTHFDVVITSRSHDLYVQHNTVIPFYWTDCVHRSLRSTITINLWPRKNKQNNNNNNGDNGGF